MEYLLSLRKIECLGMAIRQAQGPAKVKIVNPAETPNESSNLEILNL